MEQLKKQIKQFILLNIHWRNYKHTHSKFTRTDAIVYNLTHVFLYLHAKTSRILRWIMMSYIYDQDAVMQHNDNGIRSPSIIIYFIRSIMTSEHICSQSSLFIFSRQHATIAFMTCVIKIFQCELTLAWHKTYSDKKLIV